MSLAGAAHVIAACVLAFASLRSATAQPLGTPRGASEHRDSYEPPNSRNCGYQNRSGPWGMGAVYVDTMGLNSRARQTVAAGWCMYLAAGSFVAPWSSFVRWSDLQTNIGLTLDPGIEWARASNGNSRIRFSVRQTDSLPEGRFVVTTTVESQSANVWNTRALHTIRATVRNDTARFESIVVPRAVTAAPWTAGTLQFIRLDNGSVDTTRARAAAAFVRDLRLRMHIEAPRGELIRYLYTRRGDGREMLGFSSFVGSIDGFSGDRMVFANVPAAGEFYRHELVHVALSASVPRLSATLEESLAKALGGTLHRTWAQFVCEERSFILDRELAKDVGALLAKPDAQLRSTNIREWETAFLIDYLLHKGGDSALRALIAANGNFSTREASRAEIAALLGITPQELVAGVAEYNSDEALSARCARVRSLLSDQLNDPTRMPLPETR